MSSRRRFPKTRRRFTKTRRRCWEMNRRIWIAITKWLFSLNWPHQSWSFAGLGFLAWYLSGKVRVFDRRGRVAKICLVFLPLLVAALVGVSRVDDYWHHWQDVFAGGILGITIASFCYLQFFPPPYDIDGWRPHVYFQTLAETQNGNQSSSSNINCLGICPAELENVYVQSHHGMDTPIQDEMQSARRY